MLPNFLIVGAMKSGTSTLRDYLLDLDDVFVAPDELHFFSNDENYKRGLPWYESFFEGAQGHTAVGEKTPTYSYLPHVPQRIHSCLPHVKLVWMFREPVARAYSHYWHSAKKGSEPLHFDVAIAREEERVGKDVWRGYALRSMYAEQVERYLELFPREQMLFLLFEDMVKDPASTVNQLLRFLDVGEDFKPREKAKRSNVTYAPRSPRVQWLANHLVGRGSRGWNLVQRVNRRKTPGYPQISDRVRHQLREKFREPNQRLAELTGLKLDAWER